MYDYDRRNYELVQATVDLHIENLQERLGVEDMAEKASVSERAMRRAFEDVTGESPAKVCRQFSLRQAAGLLAHTDLPIFEIAIRAGFESVAGFDKAFRKEYVMCPSQYRRMWREPSSQWHVVFDSNVGCTTYTFGASGPIACERPSEMPRSEAIDFAKDEREQL